MDQKDETLNNKKRDTAKSVNVSKNEHSMIKDDHENVDDGGEKKKKKKDKKDKKKSKLPEIIEGQNESIDENLGPNDVGGETGRSS